jgi:hypothetical protein
LPQDSGSQFLQPFRRMEQGANMVEQPLRVRVYRRETTVVQYLAQLLFRLR